MKTPNIRVANRQSITDYFGTDDIATNRILMNCCFGFFSYHFGDDADKMWDDAHPFTYDNGNKDYFSLDLMFIEKHFALFSTRQFYTRSGWGDINEKTGRVEWIYESGYITV